MSGHRSDQQQNHGAANLIEQDAQCRGRSALPWLPVLGLTLGGVIIAPIAARLAGRLPHAPMGTLVGGLVILVNGITIIGALGGLPGWIDAALILAGALITTEVARRAWLRERIERALMAGAETPPFVARVV